MKLKVIGLSEWVGRMELGDIRRLDFIHDSVPSTK